MQDVNSQLAKMARREYMRQYRKNNKEKVKEINDRYWAKKAESELMNSKGDVENGESES